MCQFNGLRIFNSLSRLVFRSIALSVRSSNLINWITILEGNDDLTGFVASLGVQRESIDTLESGLIFTTIFH